MTDYKTSSLTTPGDSQTRFTPDTNTKPLAGDELTNAIASLDNMAFTKKFNKVDRNYADPPIHLQNIGLFSFIPAKGATPNKNGVFGFAKMRGNFASEDEASVRAEMIIRDIDSTHTIFHTHVGRPFPVTISEKYAAETSEIDIRRETTEAVSTSIKDKKATDKRIAEEIAAREKLLMEDVSDDRDQEAVELDEYITFNVKNAQLSWTYMEHINKIKEIKGLIQKTRLQIVDADKSNPELKNLFYDKYTSARTKAGLKLSGDDMKNSFMRYLVEDVKLPGIDDGIDSVAGLLACDMIEPTKVFQSEEPKAEDSYKLKSN